MGNYKVQQCLLTGFKEVEPIIDSRDGIDYTLTVGGRKYHIKLNLSATEWLNKDFFVERKWLIGALLLNGIWLEDENQVIHESQLKKFLDEASFPQSPKELCDNILVNFYRLQPIAGRQIELNWHGLPSSQYHLKLFFHDYEEFAFYVNYLTQLGLLVSTIAQNGDYLIVMRSSFTIKGIESVQNLFVGGANSRICFVAMSFGPETAEIRSAIKRALQFTNYKEYIIDEVDINSDRTINDEIIAGLKRCQFCIADFSYHKAGVYFEAGFALGNGKKVIYTCLESEFEHAHFDIKPLQHIIYKTPEELSKKLVSKIQAFIDR